MPQADKWAKQWQVQGSASAPYTVSVDWNSNWACSCVGWIRHFPRQDCKHIKKIRCSCTGPGICCHIKQSMSPEVEKPKSRLSIRSVRNEGL